MKENAVTFAQLTARLERSIQCDVGLRGLKILIYGWMNFRLRHGRGIINLRSRAYNDGEAWLTDAEVAEFSKYAGYNLA